MSDRSARGTRQARLAWLSAVAVAASSGLAVLLFAEGLLEPLEGQARSLATTIVWALAAFVAAGAGTTAWLLVQRAYAMAFRFAAVTLLVASVVLALLGRASPRSDPLALSSSDRDPMREARLAAGALGIEHPRLGFALPHPDMPFVPAPWVEREAYERGGERYEREHALWAFQSDAGDPARGEVTIMIDLSAGRSLDDDALEALTESALRPLEQLGYRADRGPIVRAARWLRRGASATLEGEGEQGRRVELALAVFRDPDGPRVLRLAVTIVSRAGGFHDYLERLELPGG